MGYTTQTIATRDDLEAAEIALVTLDWHDHETRITRRPLAYTIDHTGGGAIEFVTYAAVECAHPDGTREVFGVVILQHRTKTEIGWKVIPETDGPHSDRAPASILDLLTETTHPAALAWRIACRGKGLNVPAVTYPRRRADCA